VSVVIRRASVDESDEVARVFRLSRETALSFLPDLHTPEEDRAFFRTHVFPACEVRVGCDESIIGFIAFREGWIDHLYVHPDHFRRGYGRTLLAEAKARHTPLQLWTFQKNLGAKRFYEADGFRLVRETDGAGNEEREPDALYMWSR